jgi:ABC-type transport system involved in cytochrome c biogenesis permease subunit
MNGFGRYFPWVVVAGAAFYLLVAVTPPADPPDGLHLHEFGKVPVTDGGRVKPIDSAARNDLMLISGRQVFYDDARAERPAVAWMLDAMTSNGKVPGFKNPAVFEHKVFRIENDQVLSLLDLEPRPGSYRYSLNEFSQRWKTLIDEEEAARETEAKDRSLYQEKVLELGEHVRVHIRLANLQAPLAVPPAKAAGEWQTVGQALAEWSESPHAGDKITPPPTFVALLAAYAKYGKDNPAPFNSILDDYRNDLAERFPAETRSAEFEVFFNDFAPFYQCAGLYVVVFLLTCLSWVAWRQPLNRSAFWLLVLTLGVHTWALGARMYLMDRPFVFVTNLYSTAVFIGWVCALLGLFLEWAYKEGVGACVASVAGFVTMIIAHFLSIGGDTLEMMRAVLDTNFWLATHVTCVNIGYAGTLAAGLIGAIYICRGALTASLTAEAAKKIAGALYGVLCFATLFSFTGTVLGGIWADQSWGRFWGWDPKENGALMIVIWNALILHARWGGLVKQRGMAVLALVGNIVTIFSWFGVNQLGIGLHAYGFTSGTATCCWIAVGVHAALIIVGLIPRQYWVSSIAGPKPAVAAPAVAVAAPDGRRKPRRGRPADQRVQR